MQSNHTAFRTRLEKELPHYRADFSTNTSTSTTDTLEDISTTIHSSFSEDDDSDSSISSSSSLSSLSSSSSISSSSSSSSQSPPSSPSLSHHQQHPISATEEQQQDRTSVYIYFGQRKPQWLLFQDLLTIPERWAPSTIHKCSWVKHIYKAFCIVIGDDMWPMSETKAAGFVRFLGLRAKYKFSSITVYKKNYSLTIFPLHAFDSYVFQNIIVPSLKRLFSTDHNGEAMPLLYQKALADAVKEVKRQMDIVSGGSDLWKYAFFTCTLSFVLHRSLHMKREKNLAC